MRRTRNLFSSQQRAELWERWRSGESLSDISRALGRKPGTVHGVIAAAGGFAPPERRRSDLALTAVEREDISRGLAGGLSCRAIAASLGRSPSSVSREVARHGGRTDYRAAEADARAWSRARRPQACLLRRHAALRRFVAQRLARDWSPEQISGSLPLLFAQDPTMRISHETIYKSLFVQARGVLKKELAKHLRTRRITRRSRLADRSNQGRGQIRDAVTIHERPPEAEDRAVPGHWEGDLLSGADNSHVATLVERSSRFTMLVKVAEKDAAAVAKALTRAAKRLPPSLRKSLTWDRGTEMAKHREFSVATDVAVYFCDPSSPWQRGSNENTNGLLRQYMPNGTNVARFSQRQLDEFAHKLNTRPRETLAFQTPADRLAEVLR